MPYLVTMQMFMALERDTNKDVFETPIFTFRGSNLKMLWKNRQCSGNLKSKVALLKFLTKSLKNACK